MNELIQFAVEGVFGVSGGIALGYLDSKTLRLIMSDSPQSKNETGEN